MKINTRQFGEIDIDGDKIINVPQGIPGFISFKRYVLLQKEETVPFFLFQSVDNPDLSFVVLEPARVLPEFTIIKQDIESAVDWDLDKEEISCFVIVTIPNGNPEKMTGNFIAPLVINNHRKEGLQLIMQNSTYSHQQPILK